MSRLAVVVYTWVLWRQELEQKERKEFVSLGCSTPDAAKAEGSSIVDEPGEG